MNNRLKEYFHFGKSERNAILIVILLVVFLVLVPRIYSKYRTPVPFSDGSFAAEIDAFLKQEASVAQADQHSFDFTRPDRSAARERFHPFDFDPNTLDHAGWVRLGFTEKQAGGILKFREKGGRFFKKEDLRKLYAVSDEIYALLEPFVRIESAHNPASGLEKQPERSYPLSRTADEHAELNSSDSAGLVKVRGIGPAFARRIIRYREKLGGFSDARQLLEVYGMDSIRFSQISKGVFADASLVRKININTANMDELRAHPYIDYYIAKAIIDKRIRKGSYASPDELLEIPLIYEDLYFKLRPYLTVN